MKFCVMTGEPIVDVELPAKTATDRRTLMLDLEDTLRPMLKKNDHPIERHPPDGQSYVKGFPCPHCGADWHTLENHPAMRFVSPGGEAHYPANGRFMSCSLCIGPAIGRVAHSRSCTRRTKPSTSTSTRLRSCTSGTSSRSAATTRPRWVRTAFSRWPDWWQATSPTWKRTSRRW